MIRWSTKFLAALPFFAACDDLASFEEDVADVGGTLSSAPASDVLVVHFEVRPERETQPRPIEAASIEITAEPAAGGMESAVCAAPPELAPPAPVDLPEGTRWLVVDGRLVLAQGDAVEATWMRDEPLLARTAAPEGDGRFGAIVRVETDALPERVRQLAGQEIKVYDREREVCVARVAAPEAFLVEAALVHLPDLWEEAPALPQHTAAEVFEQGLVTLTAPLEPLMGDCVGGLWAAPLAAPKPVLYREAAPSPKLARQAIAAFRALPAWRDAQEEMLAFYGDGPERRSLRAQRWDTLYDTRPEVTRYVSDRGERELVVVVADSVDGCGSAGQRLMAVLDVVRTGKELRFVELASIPYGASPSGLVDLEGDGVIELIDETGSGGGIAIERWHGDRPVPSDENGWNDERHESVHDLEIPDLTLYGCPC